MRIPGVCEKCHRPRPVTVRVAVMGRIPIGICDACEEARRPQPVQARQIGRRR